ncbi:MAG TPA: CHAP domain-containing protein [Nevskiaceae bacterium]|nr:CHAP domain-containing protein [Nevskiaceae bacterium]
MLASALLIPAPKALALDNDSYPAAWRTAPCVREENGRCVNYNWYIDKDGDSEFTGNSCDHAAPSNECFDNFGYQYRNCTSFVAQKISQEFAKNISGWGNAEHWDTAASAAGYSVDQTPDVGDIAQWDGGLGHVAYVAAINGSGVATFDEYNAAGTGVYSNSTTSSNHSKGAPNHYIHIGDVPASSSLSSADTHGIIGPDAAIYAKSTAGWGGWTQEVGAGNATKLSMAGNNQMFLRGDGAVFAKDSLGVDGWTQEASAGSAIAVAISSTGLQIFIGTDGAVYGKTTIGWGGWTQEVGPGNADKIAVGGNTMMFLRGDGAMFAKVGSGGSWTQETGASSTTSIAVSSTGIHLIIGVDNAIYSRTGVGWGGWTQEVGPGNANKIALTGNSMMFLRGDGAVFAKVGAGGSWTQETAASSTADIAVGTNGLHTILGTDGAVYTKNGVGWGGWTVETGTSAATSIAAG